MVAYKTWNVNGIEGCSNRAAIYPFEVRIFCYLLDIVPRFVIAVKMSGAVTLYQTEVVSLLVEMEPTMFCHGLVMFWLAEVPSCWHADSCNFVVVAMKFGYAMWLRKKKI